MTRDPHLHPTGVSWLRGATELCLPVNVFRESYSSPKFHLHFAKVIQGKNSRCNICQSLSPRPSTSRMTEDTAHELTRTQPENWRNVWYAWSFLPQMSKCHSISFFSMWVMCPLNAGLILVCIQCLTIVPNESFPLLIFWFVFLFNFPSVMFPPIASPCQWLFCRQPLFYPAQVKTPARQYQPQQQPRSSVGPIPQNNEKGRRKLVI